MLVLHHTVILSTAPELSGLSATSTTLPSTHTETHNCATIMWICCRAHNLLTKSEEVSSWQSVGASHHGLQRAW